MLNPKLKEIFTDERVIGVLENFADVCQQHGVRLGIFETGKEFDVTVPGLFIYYVEEPSKLYFDHYIEKLFEVIDEDAESGAGGLISDTLLDDNNRKEVIDLWVS